MRIPALNAYTASPSLPHFATHAQRCSCNIRGSFIISPWMRIEWRSKNRSGTEFWKSNLYYRHLYGKSFECEECVGGGSLHTRTYFRVHILIIELRITYSQLQTCSSAELKAKRQERKNRFFSRRLPHHPWDATTWRWSGRKRCCSESGFINIIRVLPSFSLA